MTDDYQRRYEEHRKRKADGIARGDAVECVPEFARTARASIRVFETDAIPRHILRQIFGEARWAPQSCNRQALTLKVTESARVGDLLAGGEGWLGGAPTKLLIFADLRAYKSPVEIEFMPWLDAGVMMATIVNAAMACGVGSCIVNPHIRPKNRVEFQMLFNPDHLLFCGAVALGYAAVVPACPEKKLMKELVEWI